LPPVLFGALGWSSLSVYSYKYLVDRELLHDLRACQLVRSPYTVRSLFRRAIKRESSLLNQVWTRLRYFIAYHPTPSRRLQNVEKLEVCTDVSFLYAILAGGVISIFPVAFQLFMSDIQITESLAKGINVVATVLTVHLLLRPEMSRFAAFAVERSAKVFQLPAFCIILSLGSLLAILPMVLSISLLSKRPFWPELIYAVQGAILSSVVFGVIIVFTSYSYGVRGIVPLSGVRYYLSLGISNALNFIVVFLVYAIAMGRGKPGIPLWISLASPLLGAVGFAFLMILIGRCPNCHSRRWHALWLESRCAACGSKQPSACRLELP